LPWFQKSFFTFSAPSARFPLLLAALRTDAVGKFWRPAVFAHKKALFLHRQMRPATANFAL